MRPRRCGRFALLLLIPSVGCLVAALIAVPGPGGAREAGRRAARRPSVASMVCAAAKAPCPLPTPLPRPAAVPVPAPAVPSPSAESAPRRERPPIPLPRPGIVRRPVASAPPRPTTGTPAIDDPRARYLSRVYTARRPGAASGAADPRVAPRATIPEDWNDPQGTMPGDDWHDGQGYGADPTQGGGW